MYLKQSLWKTKCQAYRVWCYIELQRWQEWRFLLLFWSSSIQSRVKQQQCLTPAMMCNWEHNKSQFSWERSGKVYMLSAMMGPGWVLILHAISKLLSVRGSQSLLLLGKRLFHAVRTRTVVCEFRMLALTKKNSSESNLTLSPFSLKAFRSVIVSTIRIKPHAGLLYSGIS
mgnify:CR=1 FL=1